MTLPPSTPPPPEPAWPAWDGDAVLAGLDPDTAGLDPDAVADRDEPTDAELAGEYRCAGGTTGPSRHPAGHSPSPNPAP
jgi:hypothetical protein